MLDETDFEILELLKNNARQQWQEIGDQVHMTGQAVKNRVARLENSGIIKKYTILTDINQLGSGLTAYVTVFMESSDHTGFQRFAAHSEKVVEASRISGGGCYLLKLFVKDQSSLTSFLDEVLQFGNYKVSIEVDKIK